MRKRIAAILGSRLGMAYEEDCGARIASGIEVFLHSIHCRLGEF